MMNRVKQYFCPHNDISTKIESSMDDNSFIVSVNIKCSTCDKSFPAHPKGNDYIDKIISNLMSNHWIATKMKQEADNMLEKG